MKNIDLARYIDHSVIKPLIQDYSGVYRDVIKYNFKGLCVNPCHVKKYKKLLKNTNTSVCVAIGFPNGVWTKEAKICEGINAVKNGADELDVVINTSFAKSKEFDLIEEGLKDFCQEIKKIKKNSIIKIIIETPILTHEEKGILAKIVVNSGADFIKTGTGFAGDTTIEDITLLRKLVGKNFLIKASGGIRDYNTALKMINAGADRLGLSRSVKIMDNFIKHNK